MPRAKLVTASVFFHPAVKLIPAEAIALNGSRMDNVTLAITHASACRHANENSYGSQKRGGDGNILGFLSVRGLQHFIRLRKLVPINDQLSAELGVDLNVKNQSYFPQAALTYQASHPDKCS